MECPTLESRILNQNPFIMPIHILSIDGGGIRGIIPAMILSEIEKRTGKAVSELFDLLAGTSTGGIIAVGLNAPDPANGKPYSAEKLVSLYEQNGQRIFNKKHFIQNLGGLSDEMFHHQGMEEVLREYFDHTELKDCRTELLVTSYDLEHRKPFYFLSREARMNPDYENFLLRDIARATSAAPTYFEPHFIPWEPTGRLVLVDGGVFANNPSVLAYTEAINIQRLREYENGLHKSTAAPTELSDELESISTEGSRNFDATLPDFLAPDQAPDFFMLSLGTGQVKRPYAYERAKDWGMVQWVRPIIDILMQGVSESVHFQMEYILPPTKDGKRHYYRLNPEIPEAQSEMSDVSAVNMRNLKQIAQNFIEEQSGEIDAICETLLRK